MFAMENILDDYPDEIYNQSYEHIRQNIIKILEKTQPKENSIKSLSNTQREIRSEQVQYNVYSDQKIAEKHIPLFLQINNALNRRISHNKWSQDDKNTKTWLEQLKRLQKIN